MSKFAIISNDKVVNVIVAESIDDATLVSGLKCIDITDMYVRIGDSYVEDVFIPQE